MHPVEQSIRRSGWFLRRRDLLRLGHSDAHIRSALAGRRIFRVRQGWYSVPDAPEPAIRAVRVGGRLTSLDALATFGLRVPCSAVLHVAVAVTASRLRDCRMRRERLAVTSGVRVHWVDAATHQTRLARSGGATEWRVSIDEALLEVLRHESREVAIACCGAALHHHRISAARLDAVFRLAPQRVRHWRALVSALDESHGETFARLWMLDRGLHFEQQPVIAGVGRLDFRVGPNTFLEIDGAQHDPAWSGEGESSWSSDLERGLAVVVDGGTVIHVGYRQLYTAWPRVLAGIERAVADDVALTAYRRRHPYRPAPRRKRRRSGAKRPW